MARIWEQNEETDEDEELVVTEHRDRGADDVLERSVNEEESVEVTTDDPRAALEELGEDVASSPARRGHDNSPDAGA
ncbi:MAG: hypothetical protein ACTHZ9_06195 [Leucobacter sp.]